MGKHQQHQSKSDIEVFETGFTRVPRFWIDELMPLGTGIPASFWKFLLVLWRDIVGGKTDYTAHKTVRQFHIDKDAANQWTTALAMSGLFEVTLGKRHAPNMPGSPTRYRYLTDSTEAEWRCFIVALREVVLNGRVKHFDNKHDVEGFQISLALEVDNERVRCGVSRLWNSWKEQLIKRGTIKKKEDGSLSWNRPHETDRTRVSVARDRYGY